MFKAQDNAHEWRAVLFGPTPTGAPHWVYPLGIPTRETVWWPARLTDRSQLLMETLMPTLYNLVLADLYTRLRSEAYRSQSKLAKRMGHHGYINWLIIKRMIKAKIQGLPITQPVKRDLLQLITTMNWRFQRHYMPGLASIKRDLFYGVVVGPPVRRTLFHG